MIEIIPKIIDILGVGIWDFRILDFIWDQSKNCAVKVIYVYALETANSSNILSYPIQSTVSESLVGFGLPKGNPNQRATNLNSVI